MSTMTSRPVGVACPVWCTNHESWQDGTEIHRTEMAAVGSALIEMTDSTHEGDPRIFGLNELGGQTRECITVDEAESVAFLLLGYVAAARATRPIADPERNAFELGRDYERAVSR